MSKACKSWDWHLPKTRQSPTFDPTPSKKLNSCGRGKKLWNWIEQKNRLKKSLSPWPNWWAWSTRMRTTLPSKSWQIFSPLHFLILLKTVLDVWLADNCHWQLNKTWPWSWLWTMPVWPVAHPLFLTWTKKLPMKSIQIWQLSPGNIKLSTGKEISIRENLTCWKIFRTFQWWSS